MKIRKIASLTALVSFVLEVITSVILYIVPPGRVAYWADWHLWGLSKTEWGAMHINLGVLFLLAISFHIYYNWKPITAYLKSKAKQVKIFTREFNVALILSILFISGTYFEIPPLSWIIELEETVKDSGAKKYGEPPYGHAELSSLKTFTSRMGLDLAESKERLARAGIKFESHKQTIQEIAKLNDLPAQQIYLTMKPIEQGPVTAGLPDAPKPGLGRITLSDLCREYQINLSELLKVLEAKKIKASGDMKIREIAEQNELTPIDLYEIIRKASVSLLTPGENKAEKPATVRP